MKMGQNGSKCIPQNDLDCYYNRDWKQRIGKIRYRLPIDNFVIIKNEIDNEMYKFIMEAKKGNNKMINNIVTLKESYFNRKQYSEGLELLIKTIRNITNIVDLAKIISLLNNINVQTFFDIQITPNYREPDIYILVIGEFPLTFEKEDYQNPEKLIEKYIELLDNVYDFITVEWKYSDSDRDSFIRNIIVMEFLFSKNNLTIEESINPNITNNSTIYQKFIESFDFCGFWKIILDNLVDKDMYISYVNRMFLLFLKKFLQVSQKYGFIMIKNYLIYCLIRKYAHLTKISERFYNPSSEKNDGKKIFLNIFYDAFGYYLESIYESKHSNVTKNSCIRKMFKNMKKYCIDVFRKTNFFEHSTKIGAIRKLDFVDIVVGKQDHMIRDIEFPDLGNDIYRNLMKIDSYYFNQTVHFIGKKINRRCFSVNHDIFSFHLNAYYDSFTNMIYIPTSITHDFFFKIDRDPIYNYGSLGSIIGHELMHCFDNQGALYDHKGHLQNWWTHRDYQKYYFEMIKISEHYTKLIFDKIKSNIMLSENMADIAGLKLSLRTYLKVYMPNINIEHLSVSEKEHLKKFFQSWAQTLRRYEDEKSDSDDIDLHAPNDIRINAPFSHLDEYYYIYDVKPEHRNYLHPQLRSRILDT